LGEQSASGDAFAQAAGGYGERKAWHFLWHFLLACYPHRITSAAIESIHRFIPTARRRARSFGDFENLKAICYWMTGCLDLQNPSALTHPA
jgi:hypothetical protein